LAALLPRRSKATAICPVGLIARVDDASPRDAVPGPLATRLATAFELGGLEVDLALVVLGAAIDADRCGIAQALDNLIVNAIEHGGPTIVLAARLREGRLRIAVVDSGRASRPRRRPNSPAEVVARLSGRNRHGHGLEVVRRVAAAHGGHFALRRAERGSLAVLELPVAEAEAGR